ncbi:MAG: thioredoxin family protein [Deltaproteobacteria bacterium]|nr:thioredoxin family protein [Deltaproteobacteria bacterium]
MLTIKVLGTGCAKCDKLFTEARKALDMAGVEADLVKIEKLDDIVNYGVMMTPALVINEEVRTVGKIPKAADMAKWFKEA